MVQYYAALVITGAFKGTSRDRIYRELGLESLDLRTLDNSLQERKYLRHPFFLIVLKSGIILVRSFGKSNQQFNLKQKFSVSSDPKKTQFLRFMT